MHKVLLLSFLLASIVIPLFAARDRNHRRALKKALVLLAVFAVLYVCALLWIYPRLYYPLI